MDQGARLPPEGPRVGAILVDRKGGLWFGTRDGLRHYDGQQFTSLTREDGLAGEEVICLLEDRKGYLWIGTPKGVSRYDGKGFANFTTAEGLAGNHVISMLEDRDGHLWFGTFGSGLSQYDGLVFQGLSRKDGLPNNAVQEIFQDRKGEIWIGTEGGLTRYRPSRTPPAIRLVNVSADQRYGPVTQLQLSALQDYLLFEFQGASLATPPECMAYVYRLVGYEQDWRPCYVDRAEYADLPLGEYVFEVKAVDRDLNYSEKPATVKVKVHPPYGQLALGGGLAAALIGLAFASGIAVRRRRAQLRAERALRRELEKELQTAHELQMGLMPREAPQLPGLDLAGRCVPANHVGGDFFQYFAQESSFAIALADVTGHAMEAAIPMVMFSGILETEMQYSRSLEHLLSSLNRTLNRKLDRHTLVCFCMGEWEPARQILRFSNSGCPYPYHFRAATGEVSELRVDAYPLGVRPDTAYRVIEVQLEPGDRVVFCSDGIVEAAKGTGEMFGFERTGEVIRRGCAENLSAEALLERIMAEVKEFRGDTPQGDDQTVVVLKVDEEDKHG
jgi:serine phosphatase RsbU (regulator of sigma subunit)